MSAMLKDHFYLVVTVTEERLDLIFNECYVGTFIEKMDNMTICLLFIIEDAVFICVTHCCRRTSRSTSLPYKGKMQ